MFGIDKKTLILQICQMLKSIETGKEELKLRLQQRLIILSFLNLLIVSLLGILLRSFPFLNGFPLAYKNVLHSHSHFAFGGWVLPVLIGLTMKYFPDLKERIAYHHWRNVGVMVMFAAYGMLLLFPVYGYNGITISFSTLSIAATTYFALITWKAIKLQKRTTSHLFLKWGLIYATLSAVGPFSTAPLIAAGKQGSSLYFDMIYFYLHFQYNGFFTFLVLAFLFQLVENKIKVSNSLLIFRLFNVSCLLTFALSILWHQPSFIWNIVGSIGAALQILAVAILIKSLWPIKSSLNVILKLSLLALVIKVLLQLISAFPSIAALAYESKNFVVAYLHLVLLGFISLYVFGTIYPEAVNKKLMSSGIICFLVSFVSTEIVLVLHGAGMFSSAIISPVSLLLLFSIFFPLGCLLMVRSLFHSEQLSATENDNSFRMISSPKSSLIS
jgi:hypothetical protein